MLQGDRSSNIRPAGSSLPSVAGMHHLHVLYVQFRGRRKRRMKDEREGLVRGSQMVRQDGGGDKGSALGYDGAQGYRAADRQ